MFAVYLFLTLIEMTEIYSDNSVVNAANNDNKGVRNVNMDKWNKLKAENLTNSYQFVFVFSFLQYLTIDLTNLSTYFL